MKFNLLIDLIIRKTIFSFDHCIKTSAINKIRYLFNIIECVPCKEIPNIVSIMKYIHRYIYAISDDVDLGCLSNPCFNGGTCLQDENGIRCICTEDYFGFICEAGKYQVGVI